MNVEATQTGGIYMHYEKLKSLLEEWKLYTSKEAETPSRIIRLEKWSIAKSTEITLTEMRKTDEFEKISEEDQKIIEAIYNYLNITASTM